MWEPGSLFLVEPPTVLNFHSLDPMLVTFASVFKKLKQGSHTQTGVNRMGRNLFRLKNTKICFNKLDFIAIKLLYSAKGTFKRLRRQATVFCGRKYLDRTYLIKDYYLKYKNIHKIHQ
jgi:hypothetical protein